MKEVAENAPDYSNGFLRVPNALWRSVFCEAPFSRRQIQIIAVVLRESWGWQRRNGTPRLWTRKMTTAQFSQMTHLSTDRLSRDLRELVERGVLRERNGSYQFVTYPQAWQPKRRSRAPKALERGDEAALPGDD